MGSGGFCHSWVIKSPARLCNPWFVCKASGFSAVEPTRSIPRLSKWLPSAPSRARWPQVSSRPASPNLWVPLCFPPLDSLPLAELGLLFSWLKDIPPVCWVPRPPPRPTHNFTGPRPKFVSSTGHSFFFFGLFLPFLGLLPQRMGVPHVRGLIGAIATGLHHSHSNMGSELRLWPTPQLMATPDP